MSALKVGDLCVITSDTRNPKYIGCQVTIVGELEVYQDMDDGFWCEGYEIEGPAIPFDDDVATMAAPSELRKIDPPNTSEPRTEFLPCSDEFTEDLARWMKVKA